MKNLVGGRNDDVPENGGGISTIGFLNLTSFTTNVLQLLRVPNFCKENITPDTLVRPPPRAIGRTQSRLFDNRRPLDVGRKGAGIVEEVPTVVFESWLRDGRSEAEKKGKVSDRKRWEQLPCSAA